MTAPAPDSVAGLAAGLARGEFSAEEIARHFLGRIEALDPRLNAFVTVTPERAVEAARRADAARRRGEAGPLAGVPIAHKDLFCTNGVRTTCGSRMLADHVAAYDATVVERLGAAGMAPLGKTNMDEFAMGSSNESSWFGPVRNPWDPERVPGGSSGGSAAAVAAGLAPVATATDTGGSIRQPAALCGLTGLKPTYGRVSRYGLVAFASSFDQGGAIARSAEDLALVLAAMAGFDERDSTSLQAPVDDYRAALEAPFAALPAAGRERPAGAPGARGGSGGPLAGLRVGLPEEHFGDGLDAGVRAAVEAAVEVLEALGASTRPIRLRYADLGIPTYYMLAPAECSSNLARFDGVRYGRRAAGVESVDELFVRSRSEGFGVEVKRRILAGTYALSKGYYDACYGKAQRLRRLIADEYRQVFGQVDVVAGPTTPTTAFRLGERLDDPIAMYLADVFTVGANLAGLCALSVPVGRPGGLPAGMQLTGRHLDEARLLNVAHRFQQATGWHLERPPIAQEGPGSAAAGGGA